MGAGVPFCRRNPDYSGVSCRNARTKTRGSDRAFRKQIVTEVFSVSESLPEVQPTEESPGPVHLSGWARIFLGLAWAMGLAVLAETAIFWRSPDLIKFGAFLAVSLFSAGARIRVPG